MLTVDKNLKNNLVICAIIICVGLVVLKKGLGNFILFLDWFGKEHLDEWDG